MRFVRCARPATMPKPARAMGFCFFNNAAVGALHARARHGLQRIAVVDFDVHHGNGTQRVFERDPALFYASTHQSPAYPGTGQVEERGVSGNIVNVPLPPGCDGGQFRAAYETTILPKLDAFAPNLLVISAGFDAHHADPLAALALSENDFAWVTAALCAVARDHARGRTVSVLEGGYDLEALARSAQAHVRALLLAGSGTVP
jgi:acetoin utilization deacetylase AcuC-like enzyme